MLFRSYHWVVVMFGVLLLLTGVKMLLAASGPGDPSKSLPMRIARRVLPVTDELHGQRFLVRRGGRQDVQPPGRDDPDTEGHVTWIDEVNAHVKREAR